jgi:Fic family protein
MTSRIINQTINVQSGGLVLTKLLPPKYLSKMDHVRLFSDELLTLAINGDLTGQDWRVLALCLANMEFENILDISQSEMEKLLQVKQTNISKSMKKLISLGCLRIEDKRGKQNIYLINPYLAFKSRSYNHKTLCEVWNSIEESTYP